MATNSLIGNALPLFTAAERALRNGRIETAMTLFQQITSRHSGTLESVEALAYLEKVTRLAPRAALD